MYVCNIKLLSFPSRSSQSNLSTFLDYSFFKASFTTLKHTVEKNIAGLMFFLFVFFNDTSYIYILIERERPLKTLFSFLYITMANA